MAYGLAHDYLDSGGTTGLPVIRIGPGSLRVPRWALLELAATGRVVRCATSSCQRSVGGLSPDLGVVRLGGAAGQLRRALGPTAWVALEELLGRSATGTNGSRVASMSVRSLADSLGVAKNTAARALQRLHGAGLICAAPARTPRGAFDAGSYAITVPIDTPTVETASTLTQRHATRQTHSQLSFAIER